MDRTELGRFLCTAEHFGHPRAAPAVLLGLNGLRVSEACDTDIGDLGFDRRHRTLRSSRRPHPAATVASSEPDSSDQPIGADLPR